jgi:hypothetical protein
VSTCFWWTLHASERCSSEGAWKFALTLLERGVTAFGALRGLLSKTGKLVPFDGSTEYVIGEIARNVEKMPDETVAKALLALAGQIRALRILNRQDA